MAEYVEIKKEGIWEHHKREKNGQRHSAKCASLFWRFAGGSTKGLHEHEPVNGARRIKVIGSW